MLTMVVEQPYGLEVRRGKVLVGDSVVRSPELRGQIGKVNADGTVTTLISPARGIRGRASEFVPLPGALAIEADRGGFLYASTLYTGPASVVKIDTHRGRRH